MRSSVSQSNHLRMAVTVITFSLLWNLLLPLLPSLDVKVHDHRIAPVVLTLLHVFLLYTVGHAEQTAQLRYRLPLAHVHKNNVGMRLQYILLTCASEDPDRKGAGHHMERERKEDELGHSGWLMS